MEPFTVLESVVMPLDRPNVDTDAIIPKQFLKTIERTGLGKNLFFDWRYREDGSPDPAFVLNDPGYHEARILLARENFGCGSSREHAPWALLDYGFRCIIAPSFADIFYNNCFKNGILPVVLSADDVDRLFRDVAKTPGCRVSVDLASQTVIAQDGSVHAFQIDPFRKECLLKGLDEIGLTLRHEPEIAAYETRRRAEAPWLFALA
ncbi:MAG: 3-isopropylmalate dehydratase small subunit [Nitrospirae bacterium]|nr:3-isopropylmalate dehydratase small subunit [Nitrospirota bacterium]MBI3393499.1 3-isopropylmalate dehydratase small subunit [Nitrospirota bacterium]